MRPVVAIWVLPAVTHCAYYDPATNLTSGKRHACTNSSSNRAAQGGPSTCCPHVLTNPTKDFSSVAGMSLRQWVAAYDSAFAAHDTAKMISLRPAADAFTMFRGTPKQQDFLDFVNTKSHMIDAMEHKTNGTLKELWRPGMSLLDVGSGHAMLGAYLMAKHGLRVTAFDVPNSYQCTEVLASPLLVHFFDGRKIPVGPATFDAVSFMSVLHHAGQSSGSLLEEASRIARRWIIVLEDMAGKSYGKPTAKRNEEHDPLAIFRSNFLWQEMFRAHCRGFRLVVNAFPSRRIFQRGKDGILLVSDVKGGKGKEENTKRVFVLERVQSL